MDTRLKELVRQYDKADMNYFMATENEICQYTELDIKKLLEERENIFKKLFENYGVTRDSWGDLFMPDETPIGVEE